MAIYTLSEHQYWIRYAVHTQALKYLNGQPVIAINPDPGRRDGKLLPFEIGDLQTAVTRMLAGKAACKTISFAEATTNDGQRLLAVNDLFIDPKSHTSARYQLSWNGRQENQSSSGIIVSTGTAVTVNLAATQGQLIV